MGFASSSRQQRLSVPELIRRDVAYDHVIGNSGTEGSTTVTWTKLVSRTCALLRRVALDILRSRQSDPDSVLAGGPAEEILTIVFRALEGGLIPERGAE